jgi:LacI family transcriptional regulator
MPKYLQLSEMLESQIQKGSWQDGKIPTVREIAEAHRVSVLTVSRALQVLQGKGLVQTVERSGCYLVPAPSAPPPPTRQWGLLLRVSPGSWQPASASVVQAGFDALVQAGEPVAQVSFDLRDGRSEADLARQVRGAQAGGLSGLFFLPSRMTDTLAVQDENFLRVCRQEKLPVVLLDRNLRGENRPLEHDLVCSDHFDGGRRCTEHLLGQGRRRIACVIGSPTSSHIDREAGYLYTLSAWGREHRETLTPLVLPFPQDQPERAVYGWLAERLLAERADGVLCYQDYTAVGLILELLRRGVAVPRDLGVVGCDNLPIGNTFSLGVTTYAYPSEELARQAVRLLSDRLAQPDRPPVKVVVSGRLVVRNSTVAEALL